MNFSGISRKSLLGRILRFPLSFLPKRMIVPILQGPLRGQPWRVGAGNHGFWLGSFEIKKQKLMAQILAERAFNYPDFLIS